MRFPPFRLTPFAHCRLPQYNARRASARKPSTSPAPSRRTLAFSSTQPSRRKAPRSASSIKPAQSSTPSRRDLRRRMFSRSPFPTATLRLLPSLPPLSLLFPVRLHRPSKAFLHPLLPDRPSWRTKGSSLLFCVACTTPYVRCLPRWPFVSHDSLRRSSSSSRTLARRLNSRFASMRCRRLAVSRFARAEECSRSRTSGAGRPRRPLRLSSTTGASFRYCCA